MTAWRTKTSIRDGSPTGRFVVDWTEAEDALDAAAEATAAAEQRLRERIEALTLDPRFNDHYHRGWGKHRAAVLALLSGGSPATPGATGTTANETPPTGYPAPAASPRQGEPVDERYEALFAAVDALMYKGLEERGPDGRYPAHAGSDRDGHNILIPLRYPDGAPTHLWENLRTAYAALSEPAEPQKEETP